MDEDQVNGAAENSGKTACPKALEPFMWRRGQPSPNPGGRPRTRRITEEMNEVLDMVMPARVRKILEDAIGQTLPADMTFLRGHIFNELLASYGINTGFRLDVAKDIKATIQGQDALPIEISEPVSNNSDGDALRKHIMGRLIENMFKRSKLYNMPMPYLDRMAAEVGMKAEEVAEVVSLTEGGEK